MRPWERSRRLKDRMGANAPPDDVRLVIPHGWKTGITVAANMHIHAAAINVPLFELVSPQLWSSPLRRELTGPEPELRDGALALPSGPGLGIELDQEAVARYRTDVPA